ncbi:hypothetical protein ACFQ8W_33885 [Streptomyces sp. NPDC056508]|uniref:hypothetical protein n=1 Tax=Streptomyces sp. NPDC056508 TaxID=3345845 RepID=UPI0036AC31D2
MPNQKKQPPPPTSQAVAYGARLRAIFDLSGATRAELAVHLRSVMAKQSNAVAVTRIFDGTDIVPRAVADAIIAFAHHQGAAREAVDRLVSGTGTSGLEDAQRPAGEAGQQDVGTDNSARWSESLGELRAAAQLKGSAVKQADYWQERRDELNGELLRSEQRVTLLKAQLAEVQDEAAGSEELRRQLGRLREANLDLEAEAAAARRALRGPSPETSAQAAQKLRGQLSALRTANQRLRLEMERSNQALKQEKEQAEARAKAAKKETEVLQDRLDAATDYVRLVGRDVAERDAVIKEQTRTCERLKAELERWRIEAKASRDEVGRLGLKVLELEEQLKSATVSEPETAYTAPLPHRDTNRGERPLRRFEPPPRITRPAHPFQTGSDTLRTGRRPLHTPLPPPPPASAWQQCRDAFPPNRFLAGSALLTAVHTQIIGLTLYTFHVMLSRGTLPSERAVLLCIVVVFIVFAVACSTYK